MSKYEEVIRGLPAEPLPGPLDAITKRLDYIGPKTEEVLGQIDKLKHDLAKLSAGEGVAAVPGVEGVTEEEILCEIRDLTTQVRDLTLSEYWYSALTKIYELIKTERVSMVGFTVEADVAPASSYIYELNLTTTETCCICPKFLVCCDLGAYGKMSNLLNEPPVDAKLEEKHPGWVNKYAADNIPLPTDIPHSLHYGWDYVCFPKRKMKLTFTNTHPTQTGHFLFFTNYLEVAFDPYAIRLTEMIYMPFIERLEAMVLPEVC